MPARLSFLKGPRVATIGLLMIGGTLGFLSWESAPPVGTDLAIVGGPYVVGGKDVVTAAARWDDGTTKDPLDLEILARDDGSVVTRVRLAHAGLATIDVKYADGTKHRRVGVEGHKSFGLTVGLFLLVALWIPYALGAATNGAWYALLSEPGGGYSLSRVQILVWFLPTAVLYAATSFTLRQFVDVTTQIGLLLGMSGATAALGAAANPSKAAAPAGTFPEDTPDLRDLVTDWNENGDISRYQYLLLSLIGALTMVVSFCLHLEFPEIPSEFLLLVAGSQGTYLAVKAIKNTSIPSGAARLAATPGPVVAPAPSTRDLDPSEPSERGSFIPAKG